MTVLVEDPTLVIFIGIIAMAVLASVLPRTQHYRLVLWGMAGVLLLTVAGVLVERLVVTDTEKIEATLHAIAAALEDNDVEGVVQYVSPSAVRSRLRARTAMGQILITDTSIRNLQITLNPLTSPPSAEARFDGVIRYDFRVGGMGRQFYAAKIVAELRLEEGRWLVSDHVEYRTQTL